MRTALKVVTGVFAALVWFTHPAVAQEGRMIIVVDSRPISEHVTIRGTDYVSLEVLLRSLRFDWSLRGNELTLREGTGRGSGIRVEDLVIKLGDRSLNVTGVRRRDGVYVPLRDVVAHLGYRAEHDPATNTLNVVAARPADAPRVRIAGERPQVQQIRTRGRGETAAAQTPAAQTPGFVPAPGAAAVLVTTLEVEGPILGPDVPTSWTTTRVLDHPQSLTFKWRTPEPEAAVGRWRLVRVGTTGRVLPHTGNAGTAPEPGTDGFFTIDLKSILPGTPPQEPVVYRLEVDAFPHARHGVTPEPISTTSPVVLVYQASSQTPPRFPADFGYDWRTIDIQLDWLDYLKEDDPLSSDEPYLIVVRFRFRTAVDAQGQASVVPGTLQVGRIGSSTQENLRDEQNWAEAGKTYGIDKRGLRVSEQVLTGQPGWVVGMVVVFMEEDGFSRSTANTLRDHVVAQVRSSLETMDFAVDGTTISDAVVAKVSAEIGKSFRFLNFGLIDFISGLIQAVDPDDFGGVNVVMAATMPDGTVRMFAGEPPANEAALFAGSKAMSLPAEQFTLSCIAGDLSAVPSSARYEGQCRIRGTVTQGLK